MQISTEPVPGTGIRSGATIKIFNLIPPIRPDDLAGIALDFLPFSYDLFKYNAICIVLRLRGIPIFRKLI